MPDERRNQSSKLKYLQAAIVIFENYSILRKSGFGQTILLTFSPLARRLVTSSPEHRFCDGYLAGAQLLLERTSHANWRREMVQFEQRLRFH
jgi:hypothetical protein